MSFNFRFLAALVVASLAGVSIAQEKAGSVDPSGTWRWEYELDGQTLKDSVRLVLGKEGKVSGTYVGRSDKPIEIEEGKIVQDTVSFRFDLDFQGAKIKVAFKGKVKKDDIDGNVTVTTSEGDRDFPWAPKRSVLMEDVVGFWQLRIETGDRTLEPTLEISKVGEAYNGKYKSGDQIDVEVSNLKVTDNQLMFSMSADVNGTKIKGDYKGRPYGDKISGSIAYELGDRSGDIDFTGTRKPAK